MRKIILLLFILVFLGFYTTSCTPLLVVGAAGGGGYVGYKLAKEGYSIQITKPVKGKRVDNSTKK